MTIITQFQEVDEATLISTLNDKYGELANPVILYQEPAGYLDRIRFLVQMFDNATFNLRQVNLSAFSDDYRPGVAGTVPVVKDGVTTYTGISINAEYYGDKFKETITADAPAEMIEAYDEYMAYQKRKYNVQNRLRQRTNDMEMAKEAGLPNRFYIKKLRNASPSNEQFDEAVKLLRSFNNGRMRSAFRVSLATQMLNWLMDGDNQYKSPLSPRQWSKVVPYRTY